MSLIRQIALLLAAALLLAFAGSTGVAVQALRDSMQTQLRLKNADNAQALALALSQQRGDPALMDLVLSAQFDTGAYRQIRLASPDGRVLFERTAEGRELAAPAWFVRMLPLDSPPGVAQVSDGWRALGSVTVVSHLAYAHDDLWVSSVHAVQWLLAVALLAAAGAALVLRRLRAPLDATVEQARALVEGRFVTVEAPRVPELARLTEAMNAMVQRLKTMFEAQASQVESLRRQAHCDPLTGLFNRGHFMGQLDAALEREDGPLEGGLVLLRLNDLAGLNRDLGHDLVDRAILAIAQALQVYPQRVAGCFVGRLNGADFALALPVAGVAGETAQAVSDALRVTLPAFGSGVAVCVGAIEVARGSRATSLLAAADAALAGAESRGPFAVELGTRATPAVVPRGERAWRGQISAALAEQRARLVEFPVIDRDARLLQFECPLRVQLEPGGEFEPASTWLPLALRSRITARVDVHAVDLALQAIAADGRPRGVNLAPASLADPGFEHALLELLRARRELAGRLSVELAEAAAIEHFAALQVLARELRALGVHVGLEHAGPRLAHIPRLYEAGLDYIKLDASVTRGVATDVRAAEFIKTTVGLLRGLSLAVYAEGVVDGNDATMLFQCGVDGLTGPWVGDAPPVT